MAQDKKLHLLAGLGIAIIFGLQYPLIGLGAGIIAGVAKEVYDYLDYGLYDKQDMFATWAGSLLGAGLIYILLQGGVLNGF